MPSVGHWAALSTSVWLTLASCGPAPRGHTVYDNKGGPLPLDQVARLSGQIVAIDGEPVPQNTRRFEVLPGCHMIRMTGLVTHSQGGATLQIHVGEMVLPLTTRAGRHYIFELSHGAHVSGAPSGSMRVAWQVRQFDMSGTEGPRLTSPFKCD